MHQQGVTQNGNTIDYNVANKPCIPTSVAAGMHAAVSYYSMAQCWLSTKSPIIITQSLFVNEPRLHDNCLLYTAATDVGMHGLLATL